MDLQFGTPENSSAIHKAVKELWQSSWGSGDKGRFHFSIHKTVRKRISLFVKGRLKCHHQVETWSL